MAYHTTYDNVKEKEKKKQYNPFSPSLLLTYTDKQACTALHNIIYIHSFPMALQFGNPL